MPRKKRCRFVESMPIYNFFKPNGVPNRLLKTIVLTIDEYESIRLADYEKLDHIDGALSMGISRSVFTRLIEQARYKIAKSIIEGNSLLIEGGPYLIKNSKRKEV